MYINIYHGEETVRKRTCILLQRHENQLCNIYIKYRFHASLHLSLKNVGIRLHVALELLLAMFVSYLSNFVSLMEVEYGVLVQRRTNIYIG